MKLQHLRLAFCDEINPSSLSPSSSSTSSVLAINFKHLRPLAPKVACTDDTNIITSLGLRSVDSPKPAKCTEIQNQDAYPSGGTRWNPAQEQIRILEELYRGGMRTPNAQQIERITAELGKYGRIEGKNVFYWFQNHKARERQRQKRSAALLALDTTTPPDPIMSLFSTDKLVDNGSSKRKCRSWEDVWLMDSHIEGDGTLELFPLHPERDSSKNKD